MTPPRRFTPEELRAEAGFVEMMCRKTHSPLEEVCSQCKSAAAMLRQAASDAEALEKFEAWLGVEVKRAEGIMATPDRGFVGGGTTRRIQIQQAIDKLAALRATTGS